MRLQDLARCTQKQLWITVGEGTGSTQIKIYAASAYPSGGGEQQWSGSAPEMVLALQLVA